MPTPINKAHLIDDDSLKQLSQPWAITADALDIIAGYLCTDALTEPACVLSDSESAELKPGAVSTSIESQSIDKINVRVVDGVAVIPVNGTLTKDYGWTGYRREYSGYLGIRQQVEKALMDRTVKTIVLNVDSPGGTVDGCKECVDFLKKAAKQKDIYTYVNGQMTSAAFWLGSVGKIIAAPQTAIIGSIGVRAIHIDRSDYNKQYGFKFTYITAGKYKAIPNPDEPLTAEGKDYIEDQLNALYTIFVNDISGNLSVKPQTLIDLEAKMLLAGPALKAGLIHTIEENIDTFLLTIKNKQSEENPMDKTQLKEEHPDLYAQVVTEGKKLAEAESKPATDAAKNDVLALVKCVAGDDVHNKVQTLVGAGISALVLLGSLNSFPATSAPIL